jgi:hypothetical protein
VPLLVMDQHSATIGGMHGKGPHAYAGLCADCLFANVIRSDRGAVFYQCQKSFEDSRFPKYPRLPVSVCSKYESEEKDKDRY